MALDSNIGKELVDTSKAVQIVRIGHPILRQVAEHVPGAMLQSPAFAELIETMRSTLKDTGVGLAAPQVGVGLCLFVMEDPAAWCEKDPQCKEKGRKPFGFTVVVNPQWQAVGDEQAEFPEGCLSIPELQAKVRRHLKIDARWTDEFGQPRNEILEGWKARIFQHEFDHLQGTLYIDYLETRPAVSYPEIGDGVPASLIERLRASV